MSAIKVPGLRPAKPGTGLPPNITREIQDSFRSVGPAIEAAVAAAKTSAGDSNAALTKQLAQLSLLLAGLQTRVTALYNSSLGVPISQYPPAATPLEDGDYFIVSRDGSVLTAGTLLEILQYIVTGLLMQPVAGTALTDAYEFLVSPDGAVLEVGTLAQLFSFVVADLLSLPAAGTALVGTETMLVSPDGAQFELATLAQLATYVLSQRTIAFEEFAPGVPSGSQVLARWQVVEPVVLSTSLPGSAASAEVAATAGISLPILQNATPIGSVDFAASGSVATFTFSAPVTLAPGDVLKIKNAASPDATLASISFTLLGAAA